MANEQNLKPFTGADDPRRVNGPPKGTIHLSTHIQNMLNDEDFSADIIDAQGNKLEFKGHPVKAIIKTAIIKAQRGDKQWADWLAQNGYGSKVELSGKVDVDYVEQILIGSGLRQDVDDLRLSNDRQDHEALPEPSEDKT